MTQTTKSVQHVEILTGRYADSVTLMQISRRICDTSGVEEAMVAMATDMNLDLLTDLDFPVPVRGRPNDLIVAIRASDEASYAAARSEVESLLSARPPRPSQAEGSRLAPPRTIGSGLRRFDGNLALISVPGPHAFAEACDAIDSGCNVMIFSDNVSLEQERALKTRAREVGALVMGPDCGTTVLGGIGLGYANVVKPGRVGIVAASGTGAQQVLCLLDLAGVGVRACIGVGGRDLSSAVGGISTRSAMDLLDQDPETDLIVLVSKPPARDVATMVQRHARSLHTEVVIGLLGEGQPDLTALAERVLAATGVVPPEWPCWLPPTTQEARQGWVRGLYSGGTLCDEAMLIATHVLGEIHSNIPLRPELALGASLQHEGHVMIDFGDDALTRGRPHPMIDSTLRLARLREESKNPRCAVVVLDVVLGHGAHPNPADELVPAITEAVARGVVVVVALVGSKGDPQGLEDQAHRLCAANAAVFTSNAHAVEHAISLVSGAPR